MTYLYCFVEDSATSIFCRNLWIHWNNLYFKLKKWLYIFKSFLDVDYYPSIDIRCFYVLFTDGMTDDQMDAVNGEEDFDEETFNSVADKTGEFWDGQ